MRAKTRITSLRLPVDDHRLLHRHARRRRITLGALLRELFRPIVEHERRLDTLRRAVLPTAR